MHAQGGPWLLERRCKKRAATCRSAGLIVGQALRSKSAPSFAPTPQGAYCTASPGACASMCPQYSERVLPRQAPACGRAGSARPLGERPAPGGLSGGRAACGRANGGRAGGARPPGGRAAAGELSVRRARGGPSGGRRAGCWTSGRRWPSQRPGGLAVSVLQASYDKS